MYAMPCPIVVRSDMPPSAPVVSSNLAMPHCIGIGKFCVIHFRECPTARVVLVFGS